jgi:hypothetical protein
MDHEKEEITKTFELNTNSIRDCTLAEIIEYFNSLKDKVPDNAELRFDVYSNSWDSDATFYFNWYELETDAEFAARQERDLYDTKRNLDYIEIKKRQYEERLANIQKKMGLND